MLVQKYLEKIDSILDNSELLNGSDNAEVCKALKTWLLLEWQCNDIEDMEDYDYLRSLVDQIVSDKVKTL